MKKVLIELHDCEVADMEKILCTGKYDKGGKVMCDIGELVTYYVVDKLLEDKQELGL